MEALQKNILVKQGENIRNTDLRWGVKKIKELPGVNTISVENKRLSIQYDPYSVGKSELTLQLEKLGFKPVKEAKKGFWARWIDKLAKDNQKNFGNQRLDCCNIK
jgi:hypothetical protein